MLSAFAKTVAVLAALGMLAPAAVFAKDSSLGGDDDVSAGVGIEARSSHDSTGAGEDVNGESEDDKSTTVSREQEHSRATTTAEREDDNATTTGQEEREQHRSQVAEQVQALLKVAERSQGGIGPEVREIAHDIASSSERSDEAEAKVESRPGWMTFLIGANYKNLGALRSEISTTQNAINRLAKARDRATDASVKATLDAQIQALIESASSTEAYVSAHENVFSVFGWFFKLFS